MAEHLSRRSLYPVNALAGDAPTDAPQPPRPKTTNLKLRDDRFKFPATTQGPSASGIHCQGQGSRSRLERSDTARTSASTAGSGSGSDVTSLEVSARALPNPHSIPGSPVDEERIYSNAEWDLSRRSFVEDRGGGLIARTSTAALPFEEDLDTWCDIPVSVSSSSSLEKLASIREGEILGESPGDLRLSRILRRLPKATVLSNDSRYPAFPGRKSGALAVSTQPLPLPEMSKDFHVRVVRGEGTQRDWSTDMCAICDHHLPKYCLSLWCPCIVYSQNKARRERLQRETEDNDIFKPSRPKACSVDCLTYALLSTFCFAWPLQVSNRAQVRDHFDIDGDCLGDCGAVICCSSCELAQESRELALEERRIGLETV